jgi:nitrate reductase beta subunit
MSEVYNSQLGRQMEYPYESGAHERQWAFVVNTNRCIACQTCTMACKSTWTFAAGQEHMWWTNVESKPYGGYPYAWDMKLLEMLEKADPDGRRWVDDAEPREAPYGWYDGKTIFEAAADRSARPDAAQRALGYLPSEQDWAAPNLHEDVAPAPEGKPGEWVRGGQSLPTHSSWFFYLARLCNHCSYPACLAACPRKAIYKRPEDGIVLIDQERCRGYRKCVEACPYKKPMYRPTTRTTEKCIACYPRVEGRDPETKGIPMETRCMAACIGQVRMQGLAQVDNDGVWVEDRQSPLYYMLHVAKVALPLYPQFGTSPNGYYIPPRWVPRAYLRQMFGPGVDQAIERYMVPDRELLAVLQLFRCDNRIISRYEIEEGPKVYETEIHGKPFTLYNDTVVGLDATGQELFRTTVEEPFMTRPKERLNWI